MSFQSKIVEDVLVACGRHCSLCHKFCGIKIETHHIMPKANGWKDSFDNCIPLCFECHAEVGCYNPQHPKGRKFSENELRRHRDNWYAKVKKSEWYIVSNSEYRKIDIQLFQKIIGHHLPLDSMSYFLRQHDFRLHYSAENFAYLHKFVYYYCRRPDFEFMDMDIEASKAMLAEKIDNFLDPLSNAFSCDSIDGSPAFRKNGNRKTGIFIWNV